MDSKFGAAGSFVFCMTLYIVIFCKVLNLPL